jgi:hypothetical protein
MDQGMNEKGGLCVAKTDRRQLSPNVIALHVQWIL